MSVISFEYANDIYVKIERGLKKYNMLAYKKLMFEYYPNMKEGKFPGKLISSDQNMDYYKLELPTDSMFKKVHGDVTLKYSYNKNKNIIILETIEPENILLDGHKNELMTYKGVLVSKNNSYKDMFKIDLINSLGDRKYKTTKTDKKEVKQKKKEVNLSNIKPKKRKLVKYQIDDSIFNTYERISNEIDELDKKRKILKQKLNVLSDSNHSLVKDVLIDLYKLQNDNDPKKLNEIIKGIEYNLDLRKNMTSKIDPIIRDKAIKKVFKSAKESGRLELTKYYIYKNKVEFTNSYMGFVLNNISSDYQEGTKRNFKLQDMIKEWQNIYCYTQVEFDIIDFYKKYDNAIFASDDDFMYYINGICINGFYLKQALDILGVNITVVCAGERGPVLIKNIDDECCLIMPIRQYK